MDFGEVLKRSWEITWKHKALWLLGILASCSAGGGGGGGGPQANAGLRGYDYGSGDFPELERFLQRIDPDVMTAVVLAIACLALFLGLLAVVLGALGQAGLIAGFDLADAGHPLSLGEAFRRGSRYFWKLLVIQIIVAVLALLAALVLAVGAGVIVVGTLGVGLICLLPLLCLLVPAGFLISLFVMLTQVALVVEDLGIADAFRRGWEVLRANLGQVVLMALILILGGGLVSLVLAFPVVLVVVPAVFGLLQGGEGEATAGILASALCFAGLLPVLVLLSGILQTFVTGAWTLTFRRLVTPAARSEEPLLPTS